MDSIVLPEKLTQVLSADEQKAYAKYLQEKRPPLSPKTASELFELFLNGSTCQEIAALNPGFGLGIIVRARVDFGWDEKREEYLTNLYQKAREKVQKNQLEAVDFVGNAMAVYHKLWNTKFKKFLQTGNESELGDFKSMTPAQYKSICELLLKLTGQENVTKSKVSGEIVHKIETPTNRAISPKEAADLLKLIDVPKK